LARGEIDDLERKRGGSVEQRVASGEGAEALSDFG
jgi:hypothetical protein